VAPITFDCDSRARRMRRETTLGRAKECSQTRTTRQPRLLSSVVTRRSRRRLPSIFGTQYSRLLFGILKQRGQWCQKQPSMNTANRSCLKTKSGFPGRSTCRRQPVMRSDLNNATIFCSVEAFPRERIRDIAYERCSGVRSSTTIGVSYISSSFSREQPRARANCTSALIGSRGG
jgi:hypothetical protein